MTDVAERRSATKGVESDPPIVFLVSHASPGGAQELWVDLAAGFARRGYSVQLIALYPIEAANNDQRWTYVVPHKPGSPLAMLSMAKALASRWRAAPPRMVFAALPAANIVAAVAGRLAGNTPVVTTHHTPSQTYNRILDRIDRFTGTLRSVVRIVSVSEAVGASLDDKSARYRRKRQTIHNALPPRLSLLLHDLRDRRVGRPFGGREVVGIGRLSEQKNYPLLIRAAVHMPDVHVSIVGGGPDEARLRGQVETLGVGDRVTFLGQRSREEALTMLSTADVFAQVSLFEGHSLALLEAATIGVPMVVSDVPSQIEGITARDGTRCAHVVAKDDAVGLAHVILNMFEDPEEYQRRAALSLRLGDESTFDGMLNSYEHLIPARATG